MTEWKREHLLPFFIFSLFLTLYTSPIPSLQYYDNTYPSVKEQRAFEKSLFQKTQRANCKMLSFFLFGSPPSPPIYMYTFPHTLLPPSSLTNTYSFFILMESRTFFLHFPLSLPTMYIHTSSLPLFPSFPSLSFSCPLIHPYAHPYRIFSGNHHVRGHHVRLPE